MMMIDARDNHYVFCGTERNPKNARVEAAIKYVEWIRVIVVARLLLRLIARFCVFELDL